MDLKVAKTVTDDDSLYFADLCGYVTVNWDKIVDAGLLDEEGCLFLCSLFWEVFYTMDSHPLQIQQVGDSLIVNQLRGVPKVCMTLRGLQDELERRK